MFSWIGDVAFFVRGTTADQIDGGAVIEVTDAAKATAAFGKLVGLAAHAGGINAQPVKIDGRRGRVRALRRPARRSRSWSRAARTGP